MKSFLVMFLFISSLFGAEVDKFAKETNYYRDYNSALAVAKKENKMLMLLVVADYCPWCKKFERKTLKKKDISDFISENFIPVVIDNKRDKGMYPKEYNTPLIPSVYFINPQTEKSLYKTVAYMKRKEYMSNMGEALKVFKEEKK